MFRLTKLMVLWQRATAINSLLKPKEVQKYCCLTLYGSSTRRGKMKSFQRVRPDIQTVSINKPYVSTLTSTRKTKKQENLLHIAFLSCIIKKGFFLLSFMYKNLYIRFLRADQIIMNQVYSVQLDKLRKCPKTSCFCLFAFMMCLDGCSWQKSEIERLSMPRIYS